jgi:hypothetical protein
VTKPGSFIERDLLLGQRIKYNTISAIHFFGDNLDLLLELGWRNPCRLKILDQGKGDKDFYQAYFCSPYSEHRESRENLPGNALPGIQGRDKGSEKIPTWIL